MIDKRQVARAAVRFPAADALTRVPAERLQDRLADMALSPGVIVDLGGDGTRIAAAYPQARVVAVELTPARLPPYRGARIVADAERLPLADAIADVVWSNFCLEWTAQDAFLSEARRVLKPGGLLALTTLGLDTLKELRAVSGDAVRVHPFVDMHDLGDKLMARGYAEPIMESDYFDLTYPTAYQAVSEARNIGAGCALSGRARGMSGKTRWRRLLADYAARYSNAGAAGDAAGRVRATYEVIYATAWRREAAAADESLIRVYPSREKV